MFGEELLHHEDGFFTCGFFLLFADFGKRQRFGCFVLCCLGLVGLGEEVGRCGLRGLLFGRVGAAVFGGHLRFGCSRRRSIFAGDVCLADNDQRFASFDLWGDAVGFAVANGFGLAFKQRVFVGMAELFAHLAAVLVFLIHVVGDYAQDNQQADGGRNPDFCVHKFPFVAYSVGNGGDYSEIRRRHQPYCFFRRPVRRRSRLFAPSRRSVRGRFCGRGRCFGGR